jgi:hypothetical protein
LPAEFRLATATDVLDLLGEQAAAVLNDASLGTVERHRKAGRKRPKTAISEK